MVTAGRARAIVIGTGARTAIGKIHDAMTDQVSRLQPPLLTPPPAPPSVTQAATCLLSLLDHVKCYPFNYSVFGGGADAAEAGAG